MMIKATVKCEHDMERVCKIIARICKEPMDPGLPLEFGITIASLDFALLLMENVHGEFTKNNIDYTEKNFHIHIYIQNASDRDEVAKLDNLMADDDLDGDPGDVDAG